MRMLPLLAMRADQPPGKDSRFSVRTEDHRAEFLRRQQPDAGDCLLDDFVVETHELDIRPLACHLTLRREAHHGVAVVVAADFKESVSKSDDAATCVLKRSAQEPQQAI